MKQIFVCAILLMLFLATSAVGYGQTAPPMPVAIAGCTGPAADLSCTWKVAPMLTASEGDHVLSFKVTTLGGASIVQELTVPVVRATVSAARHDLVAGTITFKLTTTGSPILSVNSHAWDGKPFTP